MRAQVQAGVIYLALAAGIGWLWITGTGARGIGAIQAAIAGAPDPALRAKLSIRPYVAPRPKGQRA